MGCRIAEGESGEIDDAIGRQLVSLGIAIELDEPKPVPVVRAVPDEPAIAQAKAPDIAPARTAIQQHSKKTASIQNRKHKES